MQELIEVDTTYVWEAVYDNGAASLNEWERKEDGNVVKHWFADIDLKRCTAFVLHALVPGLRDLALKIDRESGQRPIFFRRYPSELNLQTGETIKHEPIHVIGWQRTVAGRNVASYTFVFPDGSILLSDDKNAV